MATSYDADLCYLFEMLGKCVNLDAVMLVGARSRDLHQRRFRDVAPSRTTEDIDLALAVDSWERFDALKEEFPAQPKLWQRIQVGSLPVDVVPFGHLEQPPGKVSTDDGHVMNVAGFQEVFVGRQTVELSNGIKIAIPSVPGFVALKLHAWLDRHPWGKFKDARDIALVLAWYESDDEYLYAEFDAIWDDEIAGETDLMAAAVLGGQVRRVLGSEAAQFLAERFELETESALSLFAHHLWAPGERALSPSRRRLQVEKLIQGVAESKHD